MPQNVNYLLDRVKKGLGFKTSKELASYLGVNSSTVSAWKKRNSVDYDLLFTKCKSLSKDWLLTGEGEMFAKKEGDHQKEGENIAKDVFNETPDKQPQNKRLTPVQQPGEADILNVQQKVNARFNAMDRNKPYFMLAIGWRLAVHKENIAENDVLIVNPTIQPLQGDLIVRGTPEGTEVARYQQGDDPPLGVITKIIREYQALSREADQ